MKNKLPSQNPRKGLINRELHWNMEKRESEIADWFILLLLILFLCLGTFHRNSLWNDEVVLWKDCLKKSPQKERVHHNLGYAYLQLKQWDEAAKKFKEALQLNPRYTISMFNLGLANFRKGSLDKAIDCYQKAITLDSTIPEPLYNLGMAYYEKGLYLEAIEAYKKFLDLKPDHEPMSRACFTLAKKIWSYLFG